MKSDVESELVVENSLFLRLDIETYENVTCKKFGKKTFISGIHPFLGGPPHEVAAR